MSFEWMESAEVPTQEDLRLTLKSRLMAHRARRKILDWKIDEAINKVQKWEIERSEVSDREDTIQDEIERRKF